MSDETSTPDSRDGSAPGRDGSARRRAALRPPRPPRRPERAPRDRRGQTAMVAVLAGLVGLVLVAELLAPEPAPPSEGAATVEPVGSVSVLCPEPGGAEDLGVRVTAAVVPDLPGQDAPGSARLRTLPGKESASAVIETPGGQAQILAYGLARPAILGRGVGGLAPGFVADQWSRDPQGQGRGLASVACTPASADQWFVGGGSSVGRRTRVLLVNPEDAPAQVDVEIYGPDGPVEAPAGRGVVVDPGSRAVLRLDALAPGLPVAAVHVVARVGRVAAAVNDVIVKGLEPLGADWVPQAAGPALRTLVPGVSDGPGARELSVLVPGAEDAEVAVRVLTGDAAFTPVGVERIDAPAGQVVTVDLATTLKGQSATVELTSSQPLVAGVRQVFRREGELQEIMYTAGSTGIGSPAAVTNLPATRGSTVRLWVSAPDEAATVDIGLLPYDGTKAAAKPTGRQQVQVAAERIVAVDLPVPADVDWYTAVVRPVEGSGPVLLAHRVIEPGANGLLVTGYPWTALRTEVSVPDTRPDLGVARPG
ncbi:MAG: DUF5719 family protein [Candidatus Nanopelagicales bacterium]